MSFERKFGTLIQKSNRNIINIDLDNDICMKTFNNDFTLISSNKLLQGNYSFTDAWFDINEDDSIYGVINAQKNSIMHIYINDKVIIKNTILKYDSNISSIQFPYIKNIDKSIHIIYYLIDANNVNKCTLVHYYKKNDAWIKNVIDSLDYNILTNFVVAFENFTPVIFYFNIIDGYEELFSSAFDLNTCTWSIPIKITTSHKSKVYLTAINASDGNYHITFSENNSNRYYCSYINAYINNDSLKLYANKTLSETIACTFPNIIEHKKILYAQWVEFNKLFYCVSYDFGENWTKPLLDNNSSLYPFACYSFKSNNSHNNQHIIPIIFSYDKPLNILGTIKNQRIY